MRRRRKNKDTQLKEFETRDLGHDIARSKAAVVVRPKTRQMPTSIFLDPAIIEKLRSKAEKRGPQAIAILPLLPPGARGKKG
ncbi:MAG: hypothetical protein E6K64_10530 [Nitrospirae bacterium]|nr:MAG: hypothetical protein E6K64_10530 [Nitrospirota bacterium]